MIATSRFTTPSPSPLKGVSPSAWARFVAALEVQAFDTVSASGGLGAYDIRPRRLVELHYATGLRSLRTETGRQVYVCEFILPWTQARFLADELAQLAALSKSTSLYHKALTSGELVRPEDTSMGGALAILHRGGRGALQSWPNLFESTRMLYDAAQGAF